MATFDVVNPFSQAVIQSVELHSKDQALAILHESYQTHLSNAEGLPKFERISILEQFATLIKLHEEELAHISCSEGGKPMADSLIEIARAINGVKLGIQSVQNIAGVEIPMGLTAASVGRRAYTRKSPIGVIFSISAFNHPINLFVHQVVPAIAAGCPVIYKPALSTPLVSSKLTELLYQAGLPKEWCTYLMCDNDTTALLAADSRLGYVSFIGSARVGWKIKSALAPGVKIALEHGGNASIIVADDAKLSAAVPAICKAGFYHAGQVCVSAQRIYVQENIVDSFVSQLNAAANQQSIGDPLELKTEIGPIISSEALHRIDSWVQEAILEGAQLICGGNKLSNNCFEPTILLNPSEKSKVTTEEIFGPVVCVYSYKTDEEAVHRANNTPFVFQASAFTSSLSRSTFFASKLNGAAVMINEHSAFRVDWMPFGGQGLSGQGMGGIDYSTQEMLKQKLIVIKD